jgi:hypothetical protein
MALIVDRYRAGQRPPLVVGWQGRQRGLGAASRGDRRGELAEEVMPQSLVVEPVLASAWASAAG